MPSNLMFFPIFVSSFFYLILDSIPFFPPFFLFFSFFSFSFFSFFFSFLDTKYNPTSTPPEPPRTPGTAFDDMVESEVGRAVWTPGVGGRGAVLAFS